MADVVRRRLVEVRRLDSRTGRVIAQSLAPAWIGVDQVRLISRPELDAKQALTVLRGEGLGDVLMLQPALRALQEQQPALKITLATRPGIATLLWGAPWIHQLRDLASIGNEELDPAVAVGNMVDVRNYPERSALHREVPRWRLFGYAFGLETVNDEPYTVDLSGDELEEAAHWLADAPRPWIAFGFEASSARRSFSVATARRLFPVLQKRGGTIIVMTAREGTRGLFGERGVYYSCLDPLRRVAAILALCDVLVSTDTGWIHVAQAVQGVSEQRRPAIVGFWGLSRPELRVAPSTRHWGHVPKLPCVGCDHRVPSDTCNSECVETVMPSDLERGLESWGL